jgi:hypothetical protein
VAEPIKFEVLPTVWGADGEEFGGGVHEVAKPTAAFLRLVAGAEAAGTVVVLEASDAHRAKLDSHVQSQEDGEAEYAKAQADGRWHEGNIEQFDLDVMSGVRTNDLGGS